MSAQEDSNYQPIIVKDTSIASLSLNTEASHINPSTKINPQIDATSCLLISYRNNDLWLQFDDYSAPVKYRIYVFRIRRQNCETLSMKCQMAHSLIINLNVHLFVCL